MEHSDRSLEERLGDAIFGNGREGLLARVARIDEQTSDTNAKITVTNGHLAEINGHVADLIKYRDGLPEEQRRQLAENLRAHLIEAAAQKTRRQQLFKFGAQLVVAVIGSGVIGWVLSTLRVIH